MPDGTNPMTPAPAAPKPVGKKKNWMSHVWPIAIMAFAIVALLLGMDFAMEVFSDGGIK